MIRFAKTLSLLPILALSSCSVNTNNTDYSYLNCYYALDRIGDIHGANIFAKESLNFYDEFDDYAYLFNKKSSYVNFQCKGTSYDDFYCEGTFYLEDMKGNVLIDVPSFRCRADVGFYVGTIYFESSEDKNLIGTIYVYTPYWCRIQLPYVVDNQEITMTFQFWKRWNNELPDFIKNTIASEQ